MPHLQRHLLTLLPMGLAWLGCTPDRAAQDTVPPAASPTSAEAATRAVPPPDTARTDSILALAPLLRATDTLWLSRGVVVRIAPDVRAESLATVVSLRDVESRELSYEEEAIVIRGTMPGWVRIALTSGQRGWIALPADLPVVPLDSIVPMSLSYLTTAWDRHLRSSPVRTTPPTRVTGIDPGEDEIPVEILGTVRNADGLWWHVRVLDYSPCESINTPPTAAEGWIPAWRDARLTVEWYSRGC